LSVRFVDLKGENAVGLETKNCEGESGTLAGLGVCNPTFSELQLGNTSERFDTKGL
jgi:hypothetical protein